VRRRYSLTVSFALISMGLVLIVAVNAEASDTFTLLYDFNYYAGADPIGDLIFDSAGNIYGTAASGGLQSPNCEFNCGVVFELSPSGGGWTYKAIYYFTGGEDGGEPHGRLTLDAKGNLYGTTYLGGTVNGSCSTGCGTVFELSPSAGDWNFTLLHSFSGPDGSTPWTGLTPDSAGKLYGTTTGGGSAGAGTVFGLSPSGGSWAFSTLYDFKSYSDGFFPFSDLAIDGAGNLYGATLEGGSSGPNCYAATGCGTVFELSSSGGVWKFSVLHTFQGVKQGAKTGDGSGPWGAIALDSAGNVYGTTSQGGRTYGGGTVFKVSQSAGKWKEQILHRFGATPSAGGEPLGGVTLDKAGNLYGTTSYGGPSGNGTVFSLTPLQTGGWKFASLYSFSYNGQPDGIHPEAGVIPDAAGNLYGTTTSEGGDFEGTVFELSPQ
jgi:uncharacterized repeat protein (TIGR03803 family)